MTRDPREQLLAWQPVLPTAAAVTHLSAAAARGWWLPPLPADLPVFVHLPASAPRPRRAGLVVTRHRTAPVSEPVHGLRCATAAETLLACARDLSLVDLVVLVDSALQRGDVSLVGLVEAADQRRRGAPGLRKALRFADGRSESPWETLLRLLHVMCGIAVEPQHEVFDEHGTFVARGDLWLVGSTDLHEYDGRDHLPKHQQRKDLKRARRLGHTAWVRRGYTSEDVLHQAVGVLRDADAAIGRAHDPRRIRVWHRHLRDSLFTPAGTARLRVRLGLPPESGQSATA